MTRMNQPPREHNSDPAEGIRHPEATDRSRPGAGDEQSPRPAGDPERRPHADTAAEGE